MIRVLIAEDDSFSSLLLQRVLRTWGFDPVPYAEGKSALKALLCLDGPPIGLLDWYLPDIGGLEICETVRQSDVSGARYLMMVTANTDPNSHKAALGKGADAYLLKPVDFGLLLAKLQEAKKQLALDC